MSPPLRLYTMNNKDIGANKRIQEWGTTSSEVDITRSICILVQKSEHLRCSGVSLSMLQS